MSHAEEWDETAEAKGRPTVAELEARVVRAQRVQDDAA